MHVAALLALTLLGQKADAGALTRSDAGVTARVDAGVVVDAPRPAAASAADTKRLEREVAELRQRVAETEARLSKAEASLPKVDELGKQLRALEARLEEAEARRVEAEERVQRRKLQLDQAASTLTGALQVLSTGGTGIEGALRFAEGVYTGAALQHLRAARQALVHGDLNAARTAITLAMLEAQAER